MLKKSVFRNTYLMAVLFVALFAINPLSANKDALVLHESNVSASSSLGNISLSHNKGMFSVIEEDGYCKTIQNCFVDKKIRNCSTERLQRLLGNIKDVELNGQTVAMHRISPDLADQILQENVGEVVEIDADQLAQELSSSSYIKVNQMSNGEYALHLNPRMLGGGVGGGIVGAWTGKFVSSLICHGAIALVSGGVSLVATPAVGAVVFVSLEKTVGVYVESITTAAALAGGITGAVLTGPV